MPSWSNMAQTSPWFPSENVAKSENFNLVQIIYVTGGDSQCNCLNDKFLAHYNCFLDSDIVMPSWPSSKDRRLIELDFLPTLWIDNFNVSNNLFRSKDSHTNLYALLLFQRGRNITQTIRAQLPQNETCQAAQTGHVTKNTWVQCPISF